MNYTPHATDQYMRSVLIDELSDDEADNALTALSTLTSLFPGLFPFERTFARPDHNPTVRGPAGVRFVVFGDNGVERMVQIPREDLSSVAEAVEAATIWASLWVLDAA
jgi:hypothetical protein